MAEDQDQRDQLGDDERDDDQGAQGERDEQDNDTGQDDSADEQDNDPAKLAAELRKLQRENLKLKRENTRRRVAEKKNGGNGEGAESARELETARQQAEVWRSDAIAARAESRLIKAGADPDRVGRLIRMIDVKELEIDPETRRVDGLDEQIEELRDEYPELFAKEEPRRRPRLTTGERRTPEGGQRAGMSATSRKMLGR